MEFEPRYRFPKFCELELDIEIFTSCEGATLGVSVKLTTTPSTYALLTVTFVVDIAIVAATVTDNGVRVTYRER